MMEIFREFTFEAAHRLPAVTPNHKCARLHGHSYHVAVHVNAPIDPVFGWVMDFADIAVAVEPVRVQLDHHYLNDIDGLANPTSENLARWIWERLLALPLCAVIVRESARTGAIYRGRT